MNQHEANKNEGRRFPLPIKLGVLALIGGVIWFIIGTVAIGFVGWGDGAVHSATAAQKVGYYTPSAYCFLIAFSCLPFVRGIFLIIVGVLANGTLALIFYGVVKLFPQWSRVDILLNFSFAILPLVYLDVQWFALCKQRLKE